MPADLGSSQISDVLYMESDRFEDGCRCFQSGSILRLPVERFDFAHVVGIFLHFLCGPVQNGFGTLHHVFVEASGSHQPALVRLRQGSGLLHESFPVPADKFPGRKLGNSHVAHHGCCIRRARYASGVHAVALSHGEHCPHVSAVGIRCLCSREQSVLEPA